MSATVVPATERTPGRLDRARALVDRLDPWLGRLLVLMPVAAVLGPYASLTPGRPGSLYLYRIVWLLLAIPAALRLFSAPTRKEKIVWAFTSIVAMWAVWAPLTALWAPGGKSEALGAIAPFAASLGALVGLIMSRGDRRLLDGMRESWVVGLVCGLIVVAFEVFFGHHLVRMFHVGPFKFVNVWTVGLRHNPNDFAMVMGTGVIAVVITMLRTRRLLTHLLGFVLLLGAAYVTLSCNSRFAMLTYGIAIGLGLLWSLRKSLLKTAVPYLLLLALVGLPLVNGNVPKIGPPVRKAVQTVSLSFTKGQKPPPEETGADGAPVEDASPTIEDTKTEALAEKLSDNKRVTLTKLGLRYLGQAPIIGHGLGAWEYLQPRDPASPYWWLESLHNSFLQMGLELGVVGLLPLLATLLLLAWLLLRPRALRRMWRDPMRLEAVCFTVLVLVFSVAGSGVLGDVVFWLALAYACALAWAARRTDDEETGRAAEGHGATIR